MPRIDPKCGLAIGLACACSFLAACGGPPRTETAAPAQEATSPSTSTISADVQVSELRPGVWIHTSWYTYPSGTRFPSNGLIVQEGDHLLLIDTAWGELLTEQLLNWIDATLRLPVTRAIVTHSHHDRIGGAAALERRGIPILAHPLTRRFAAEQGLPIPDTIAGLAVAGSAARIGAMEVYYPGPAHAHDNLMVWLPETGILFGGCAVRSSSAASLGNVAHADVAGWPSAMERAERRYGTAELVVPGHGDVGGAELLRHTLSLFSR